ncbi:MAG TPA: polysaccharide deacetylase family protein [Firmicutes bacterium]|jgi:peptidoglycan/xylan/chitin deacetylase (PgdA/CDA1 family)|nr:polysaccharide deacetylase family protein [Bacillota bacterium]
MQNGKRGVGSSIIVLLLLLAFMMPADASQYYINELLEANPPPQVLKEGPVVRVKQPGVQKQTPDEGSTEVEEEKPLRKVALTFDDGPEAHYTSRILDILQVEGVSATFFVVGEFVARYPKLVQRMYDDGHLIANHSHTHGDLSLLTNEEIIALELAPTSRAVEKLTGFYPMIMRPPYGSLRDDSVRYLKENGWKIVRWSLDTFDWDSRRNKPEQIITRIQTQHHPGAIVLMHCNGPATTRVLPDIIKTLRELGYQFVTVTQL